MVYAAGRVIALENDPMVTIWSLASNVSVGFATAPLIVGHASSEPVSVVRLATNAPGSVVAVENRGAPWSVRRRNPLPNVPVITTVDPSAEKAASVGVPPDSLSNHWNRPVTSSIMT